MQASSAAVSDHKIIRCCRKKRSRNRWLKMREDFRRWDEVRVQGSESFNCERTNFRLDGFSGYKPWADLGGAKGATPPPPSPFFLYFWKVLNVKPNVWSRMLPEWCKTASSVSSAPSFWIFLIRPCKPPSNWKRSKPGWAALTLSYEGETSGGTKSPKQRK